MVQKLPLGFDGTEKFFKNFGCAVTWSKSGGVAPRTTLPARQKRKSWVEIAEKLRRKSSNI